jgi:hypothetical protein
MKKQNGATEVRKGVWKGRSLSNYKALHEATAKERGCREAFMAATTLTRARKILFGN